jgi:dTDP-4-amino-4,6-dideoxygalactose transaminase
VALPGAICHEVVVAVLAAGCEPVFCDVNPADGLVEDSEWARARALGADVAIMVHLYGNPAAIRPVRRFFPAPDCLVIDDAAQALGSSSDGGIAGATGDVGLLSFGPTKQISIGNAALLFKDPAFAKSVAALLARLRAVGDTAADGFSGLLNGLQPILGVPRSRERELATVRALEGYTGAAQDRMAKMQLWSRGLEGTGLVPVGMSKGCVPWRYVCRLPGLSWDKQHQIANDLRADGMDVSNWYLPAHWYLGFRAGMLPGVEKLAREVFQFWLDRDVTPAAIAAHCMMVKQRLVNFHGLGKSHSYESVL